MRQNGEKMSENNDTINNQEEEYEKICYICRRPESKAGKSWQAGKCLCVPGLPAKDLILSITAV